MAGQVASRSGPFLKKRTKKLQSAWPGARRISRSLRAQKFFGSFFQKRTFLLLVACILTNAAAGSASAADRVVHIGYQKYGTLEKRLAPLHATVTWTEFLGGPALMEAMGAGSIDFGITGDTPPIFAQASGVKLAYVGVEPASPHGEAVIVLNGSPIRTIADLRGKRVALNRGSNVHNLLVRVLAEAGMTPSDIQTVFLKPSDARPAFENGSVDAWVIWDPYLAAAETALPTRTIADGVTAQGRIVDENREFFLASADFAASQPDLVRATIADLAQTEAYAASHRAELTALLAPAMGMDPKAVQRAVDRLSFGVLPVDAKIAASQQDIADTLEKLSLIPGHVDINEAIPAHAL
jgi:sulfonate transport system substrate-binding protein